MTHDHGSDDDGRPIAVMRNGRILQFGKAEEIYQRLNNIFIAGFIDRHR